MTVPTTRTCAWCQGPIPARARRDAITCSQPCRQARHRVARYVSPRASRDGSRAAQRDTSRRPGTRAVALGSSGPRRVDAFTHGVSVLRTLPSRVIGAKPPAFCRWIFDLVGATADDTLDDLFPGSGIVGRTWELFRSSAVAEDLRDASWPAAVGGDAS